MARRVAVTRSLPSSAEGFLILRDRGWRDEAVRGKLGLYGSLTQPAPDEGDGAERLPRRFALQLVPLIVSVRRT